MNFTIKELAELLNVSKGTISNHAIKRNLKLNKNEHNIVLIQLEQSKQIAESINQFKSDKEKINIDDVFKEYEATEDIKEDTSKAEAQRSSNNDDLVELLKSQIEDLKRDKSDYLEQLNTKDKQIEQLNTTLDEQQKLLHNQQSLQLQSNEKIKALEIELQEVKEDNTKQDTNKVDSFYKDLKEDKQENNSTTNKKDGLLSRFFK
ncbi:DUF536 domain-containing protein (plasmid) [Macrococcoides bohemicum]|uniref:DUF536 domain-containing protein n=1 Tax=Macrococcoides bohemicum TaxID=1903056 RepID=UPI001C5D593B|nr:DUF536 domain-containing protein [Macrococcus bohemicus]QYA46139.1 DUF536 domain-containing protein [Macrococcus bohemicus]